MFYFGYVDIVIVYCFVGENLWAQIKKYKQKIATRRATEESLLTDITDGAEYVRLYKDNGFLSCPNNISFLVNTGNTQSVKNCNQI